MTVNMTTRLSAGRRALSRRRPDNLTLLLVALGILGAALVLARQVNYGVGLEWDAVNYISVARSVLAGNGFIQFDGVIYHAWSPLYPLLLAGASLGIFDPLTAAGPLNAGLFGLAVFAVGMYLRTRLESRLLTLWCCLAIVLAQPLLNAAYFAWSEMPFILFSVLALMTAERLLSRGDNSALIWAGAFTALACLSRYAGITLVAVVVPLLALQRGVALPEKARRIIIYALIALAPLSLWLLRNQLLVGSLTGNRDYPIAGSPIDILHATLNIIAQWFPDPRLEYFAFPTSYALLGIWIALLAIVSGGAVRAYLKNAASPAQSAQLLFTGFAAVYAIAIIVSSAQGFNGNIRLRYLVPAYLPLLLATALALDAALHYTRQQLMAAGAALVRAAVAGASIALIAGLFLWLAYQIPANVQAIYQANSRLTPLGYYNYAYLADSEVLRYLRNRITDGVVFSNHEAAAYIHSGGLTQHDGWYCDENQLRYQMSAASAAGAVYLLWLYGLGNGCVVQPDYYVGLSRLLTAVPVEPIAAFADGALFRYRSDANADARRELRQHYAAIADGVPTAASYAGFSLYLDNAATPQWLTYINDQCAPDDTQALFFLNIIPVNSVYLDGAERQHGFSGQTFEFDRDGIRIDGQCMVSARLPDYPIASISTGQVVPGESVIWEVEYEPGRAEQLLAELAQARQAQPPVSQDNFVVYHNNGRLIYAKEPCTPADTAAAFFLHITPTDAADLPASSRQHGFDDRVFNFYQAGALVAGQQCIASAALPDYNIANVHTGQYVPGSGAVWELEYEPGRAKRLRAELAAVRQARLPIIQADFAIYHNAGQLIYAKEPCTPADTAAPFFLHLVPTAAADLPAISRQHGFDNRDFPFETAGALSDGQCIASVALPEYNIAIIRTGQYTPGAGRLWETEFAPAAP